MFVAFLILGPLAVLPCLVLLPAQVSARAAWGKQPRLWWRLGTIASVAAAVLLTVPASPLCVGLERPIDPTPLLEGDRYDVSVRSILAAQCVLLNAALIGCAALLPLSSASAWPTLAERRRASHR